MVQVQYIHITIQYNTIHEDGLCMKEEFFMMEELYIHNGNYIYMYEEGL